MFWKMLILSFGLIVMLYAPTGNAQAPECSAGEVLVPHPSICQRYTNCSIAPPYPFTRYLKDQEGECRYPDLFDINELKCKDFKEAVCGPNRVASKIPCDYVKNLCGSAHCESCQSRRPSCVGRENGTHAHPTKEWSPYYIVCDTERTIIVTVCPKHAPTNTTSMFSPIKNRCVSAWEIPPEHNGAEPSCQSKEPGLYRVANRPDVYYSCPGPQVSYCGVGSVFNETTQVCQKSADKPLNAY